jgi:drug/metabolite transporter (DMT)-like permease
MSDSAKTDFSVGLVLFTVLLTVYGQLIAKWRVHQAGPFPTDLGKKMGFLTSLLFDPWIISGILAAFLAALSWMAALTKLELSYAYPFLSLAFVLVVILSTFFFHEPVTLPKVLGIVLVIAGLIVSSQG